jgi:Zn-dependent protease with chaperone function
VQQAFSSHPATEERAARMKEAAEAYIQQQKK